MELYHFDKKVETVSIYWEICNKSWECDEVVKWRENYRLFEATWPESINDQPEQLSSWLAGTFKTVFGYLKKLDAEHLGFAYYGHGSRADGALFEGLVQREDSKELLADVKSWKK